MVLIISKQSADEYESTRLLQSFTDRNIEVMLAHPDDFDIVVTQDIQKGLKYKGEPFSLPKVVLVRFGAGILPFQLAVIRHFEQAGVPCINTSESIELVKDKLRTSQILSKERIAIPHTMMVRFPVDDGLVEKHIGYPCVVKVVTGSYGEGVYLCEKKRDYRKLMEFIDSLGNKKTMIVQEYLGDHPGEDLRVLVIGGEVIGAMKRTAPEGDFRANITNGGTGSKYELTDEIVEIARNTALSLGLDIAGIDLLFDKRGFRVCEANSNPGFNGFDTYCNFDVGSIIVDYIETRLTKQKK